jgi:hypothetical protein
MHNEVPDLASYKFEFPLVIIISLEIYRGSGMPLFQIAIQNNSRVFLSKVNPGHK